jgi:hypothetical protein
MFNRETFLSYFYCVDGGVIALKGTCDKGQDANQLKKYQGEGEFFFGWRLVRPERTW